MASDTALRQELSKDKSASEAWIPNPGNVNNNTDLQTAGNIIPGNIDSDIESNVNNTNTHSLTPNEVKGNNDVPPDATETINDSQIGYKTSNSDNINSSSCVKGNNEMENQMLENNNNNNNVDTAAKQQNSEEMKQILVGNLQKCEDGHSVANMAPVVHGDVDMCDPELVITDEEIKELELSIQQRKDEIINKQVIFEKWLDSLTRRRMFAMSRLRKLGKHHVERIELYGKVQDYVKEVESILSKASDGNPSSEELTVPQSQDNDIGVSQSQSDDLQKEDNEVVVTASHDSGQDDDGVEQNVVNADFVTEESPTIVQVHS